MKSSDREARRAPRSEHYAGAGATGAPQAGDPTPAREVRPLSAVERAAFSAQEAALADLNLREKGSRLIPWEQGAAVLEAKRNGYHDRVHLGQSSRDYPADIATATGANTGHRARERLRGLGIEPQGLPGRRVVLVPPDQDLATLERRKQEYPGAEIRVLRLRKKDRFPGICAS